MLPCRHLVFYSYAYPNAGIQEARSSQMRALRTEAARVHFAYDAVRTAESRMKFLLDFAQSTTTPLQSWASGPRRAGGKEASLHLPQQHSVIKRDESWLRS